VNRRKRRGVEGHAWKKGALANGTNQTGLVNQWDAMPCPGLPDQADQENRTAGIKPGRRFLGLTAQPAGNRPGGSFAEGLADAPGTVKRLCICLWPPGGIRAPRGYFERGER
jgi:hypothetical protein